MFSLLFCAVLSVLVVVLCGVECGGLTPTISWTGFMRKFVLNPTVEASSGEEDRYFRSSYFRLFPNDLVCRGRSTYCVLWQINSCDRQTAPPPPPQLQQ